MTTKSEGPQTRAIGQEVADGQVARRFSWLMRATCSPWGSLCDPSLVGGLTAIVVVCAVVVHQTGEPSETVGRAWIALCAVPAVVALITTIVLGGARKRVVGWLAALPFAIDNLNSVFNGLGDTLELQFAAAPPSREVLNDRLEVIDENCFVTDIDKEERRVSLRLGVVDSKWLPTYSNYRRWQRVQQLVAAVLLPLQSESAIDSVRIG